MKTNLEELTGHRPLYNHYGSQTNAQDAFIEIDTDGDVRYDNNGEIGNAIPCTVFNGTTLRIAIPNYLTQDGYKALHEEIKDEIQTVLDGFTEVWDGNNWVGKLTDDAREALEELERKANQGEFEDFDQDEEHGRELAEQRMQQEEDEEDDFDEEEDNDGEPESDEDPYA